MFRRIGILCAVLLVTMLACRVQVNFPVAPTVGPPTTEEIHVPAPQAESIRLTLQFGAGRLSLRPGAKNLVDGEARYNLDWLKPEVMVSGGDVVLKHGSQTRRFLWRWGDVHNEWNLQLGEMPLDVTIEAGAYQAEYEFGGLNLTNLTIRDGASTVKARFSQPNAAEMRALRYETGASNVTLTGLANANFSLLEFNGGAGNYSFEFGGELRRPASVHIAVGVSNVMLVIPPELAAQVTVEGVGNVSVPSGWIQSGNVYTQAGEGSPLTIVVEMGAGNLTILASIP